MEYYEIGRLVCIGFLIIGSFVFVLCEPSISSSIDRLELKDTLAEYHVIKYYPEFENCTIVYDFIDYEGNGAKIYCGEYENLESRDGMSPVEESRSPTKELLFKDIKLKEIYWDWKADLE